MFNNLIKKISQKDVLSALLVVFIIYEFQLPKMLAGLVDNLVGRVAIIALALSLFMHDHVVGALAIVAAYVLIHRAEKSTGRFGLRKFLPTQAKKDRNLSAFNQFPVTVEEEVVSKMIPYAPEGPAPKASYKPVQDKLHDAEQL